jgi:uncharacterized protein (DUF849 family)
LTLKTRSYVHWRGNAATRRAGGHRAPAAARRWSTWVGLEDGKTSPSGATATDNAAPVAAEAAVFRKQDRL